MQGGLRLAPGRARRAGPRAPRDLGARFDVVSEAFGPVGPGDGCHGINSKGNPTTLRLRAAEFIDSPPLSVIDTTLSLKSPLFGTNSGMNSEGTPTTP